MKKKDCRRQLQQIREVMDLHEIATNGELASRLDAYLKTAKKERVALYRWICEAEDELVRLKESTG